MKLDPPLGRCVKVEAQLLQALHKASEFTCDMTDSETEIDGKAVHSVNCWKKGPPPVDYRIYPTKAQCRLGRQESDH